MPRFSEKVILFDTSLGTPTAAPKIFRKKLDATDVEAALTDLEPRLATENANLERQLEKVRS